MSRSVLLLTFSLIFTASFGQRAPQYYETSPMPSGSAVLVWTIVGLLLAGILFFVLPTVIKEKDGKSSPLWWLTPVVVVTGFLCFLPLLIWIGTVIVLGGQALMILGVVSVVVFGFFKVLLSDGTPKK